VARAGVPDVEAGARRAWVFKIARNLALNHMRDRSRVPPLTTKVDPSRHGTQEVSAAVRQALDALPDLDRDVFLLRESAGLSYEEISSTCDISADAVRSRLHRARQQLREMLGSSIALQQQRGIRYD
jgi:RNA polymerase sigma factor (sigma-70 family)